MNNSVRVFFEFQNGDSFGTAEISASEATLIVSEWATGEVETEAGDHMVDLTQVTSIKFFR